MDGGETTIFVVDLERLYSSSNATWKTLNSPLVRCVHHVSLYGVETPFPLSWLQGAVAIEKTLKSDP